MTDGKVRESNGHLFLVHPIRIEGPTGINNVYDAIVDTGFTGQLALPVTLCTVLELEYVRRVHTMFGNASFEDIGAHYIVRTCFGMEFGKRCRSWQRALRY